MDVLLTEEEKMVRNIAREFLEAECPTSLVRAMETDATGYPPALWRKAAELGWLGMALPEKYGGQDLPLVYLGLVLEEVGRAVAPLPLHSTVVAALTIAKDGTEAQREAILPAVVRGDAVLTWAFTEQDPRFLPETIRTQAVADGDHFVLNGTKLFVDNFAVVPGRLPHRAGLRGPRGPLALPGGPEESGSLPRSARHPREGQTERGEVRQRPRAQGEPDR